MADHQGGHSSGRPRLQRGESTMTTRRVAAAKYDLELTKSDVCRWLSEILQLDVTPPTFMESLDTGVELCKLVELIQEKAKAAVEAGEELGFKVPPDPIKYRRDAKKGTFHARENTKHFLDWCRGLGIRDDLIFETNGLVEHADEKRVLLCLLEVSRYARWVHIKPPNIISEEEEQLVEEVMEKEPTEQTENVNPGEASESHNAPEPNTGNGVSKLHDSEAEQSTETASAANKPSGGRDVVHNWNEHAYFPFLNYCYYPFLFSFILLLLLLGSGIYLRRKK